ncbi:MAG: amino acid permease [Acidobacteriota bacterium]|nr:amino acid permease [Acidobacteriota bacterium]
MTSPSAASTTLERRLGPWDAAAIVVANVIGGGILFTPPQVAAAIPNPWWFLGAWLAGGALAFAGAMAYAELAALRPKAGGEYVYLGAAYGRLAAFLTGWTSFVAGFAGAIATSAVFLAIYLGRFVPAAADDAPFVALPLPYITLALSPQSTIAIAAIWLMSWIHLRGLGPGRLVGNILAALKVSALLLFIALGFAFGAGSMDNLGEPAGPVSAGSWFFALIAVMFAYSGWNAASYLAEEIRDPGRNVPRALAIGTAAVILVYLLLNLLYIYVVPVGELATVQGSVLDVIADRMLGTRAGDIMGMVSIVSLAASISAMVIAGPRVYYAMARDGLFFRRAASIHPKYKTPAAAIVAQAIWATLLVLSGSGNALLTYTGFSVVLFAGIGASALFVLRVREPDAPRPFKTMGYPFVPGIFVLASLAIVISALWTDLVVPIRTGAAFGPSAVGLLVIALGLPLYALFSARSRGQRA